MKPNAIGIVSDANQFPAAAFLAQKLVSMNPRSDTDVFLTSTSRRDLRLPRRGAPWVSAWPSREPDFIYR